MEKKIQSFFEKKKRDLSDKSNDGDERKKQREGSLELPTEENTNDVFNASSDSSEGASTFLELLKKLDEDVKGLFAISTTTRDEQIKGTTELQELKASIKFVNEKFEEYEKDKKEREKEIKDLKEEVEDLKNQLNEVDDMLDKQEQYSRRNCLLIHGVREIANENTDNLVISTIKENMDAELVEEDIDRTHRIGKKREDGKPRPNIVKFARYNRRRMIYQQKKKSLKVKELA